MTANMAATEYKRKLRCRSTNNDIDDTVGTAGDTSTPGISSNSTPYRTPGLLGEILTRRRSAPASTKPLNREDDSGTSTIRAPPRTPVGDAPPHEDSTASFDNLKINLFGVDDASDSQMMRVETPQSKTVAVANTSNLTTITPTAVDTCTQDVVKDVHTTISPATSLDPLATTEEPGMRPVITTTTNVAVDPTLANDANINPANHTTTDATPRKRTRKEMKNKKAKKKRRKKEREDKLDCLLHNQSTISQQIIDIDLRMEGLLGAMGKVDLEGMMEHILEKVKEVKAVAQATIAESQQKPRATNKGQGMKDVATMVDRSPPLCDDELPPPPLEWTNEEEEDINQLKQIILNQAHEMDLLRADVDEKNLHLSEYKRKETDWDIHASKKANQLQ